MEKITVEDNRQQAKVKIFLLPSLFAIIIARQERCRGSILP